MSSSSSNDDDNDDDGGEEDVAGASCDRTAQFIQDQVRLSPLIR